MDKYILLIYKNSFHDTDALLMTDEKILCVLETERISKHKHAEYEDPEDYLVNYIVKHYNIPKEKLFIKDISCGLEIPYYKHHELHAMASYLSSGYENSAILVIDGEGDQDDGVTLFFAKKNKLFELKKYESKYSLGVVYCKASDVIYNSRHSEGKLMGLSCYAEPEKSIPSPVQYHEDGTVECICYDENSNKSPSDQIEQYIKKSFDYLKIKNGKGMSSDLYKAKIASTTQWWFTEQVKNIVKYLKSILPNVDNLCICGGCFLNCETNGIIDRMGLFKNIYCVPAPADNSIILGAAQQLLLQSSNKSQKIESAYLGPKNDMTLEEIKRQLKIKSDGDKLITDMIEVSKIHPYSEDLVIDKLEKNNIVIWFDGESEFGPRALGHRSFLANPTSNKMFWDLSVTLKNREYYRPLAPITTDNLYEDIFEDPHPENLTQFMLKTVKIKEKWINKIKTVVHVDKTARPQRLTQAVNPELYSLITNWHKKTGIPCLVNTSLNLKGQPIVETLDDLKNILVYGKFDTDVLVVINHTLCLECICDD